MRPETHPPYLVVAGAVDGPDGERVIEAAASAIGNRLGGQLHILHLALPTDQGSEATLALLQFGVGSVERVAAEMQEELRVRVYVHIRSGSPWREIVDEAARIEADLIVVGTHGRTGAARLILGSDGEQVLRHSACPVLFVRDHDSLPPRGSVRPPDVQTCRPDGASPDEFSVEGGSCATGLAVGSWIIRP